VVDAEVGEVLRDRAEHVVDLVCTSHIAIRRWLGRAALEQRDIAVDHPHGVDLMLVALTLSQAFCVRASIEVADALQRF
jgi:hypothetical protein